MNKSRLLVQASIYRKFLFQTKQDLEHYMASGHKERWIVRKEEIEDGRVWATIGEAYNNSWKLLMEEVTWEQIKHRLKQQKSTRK